MEPFLRWVGGKRWLAPTLVKRIREHLSGTYYEPFIGSGAVFFQLAPKRACVADTLEALTATYRAVKDDAIEVWKHTDIFARECDSPETYELFRSRFNALLSHGQYTNEFAALFIYLNRTGFNGLWRQNKDGEFNVPYGDHSKLKLPSFADLLTASQILQSTSIHTISHSDETLDLIRQAESGDVVYADPPYVDTFQDYDGLIKSSNDFQESLAIELWQAVRRGAIVFVTNNDCPETRRWYGAFAKIETYNRSQSIAGTVDGRKRWNQILAVGMP